MSKVKEITARHRLDEQIALEQWERYKHARDTGHLSFLERSKKNDDFYCGDQWDEKDKAKLEAQGRPALTINQIFRTVNSVLGEQLMRRADLKFKPGKDGAEEVATVLNKLVAHITEDEDFDTKESEVFADGIIQERGFFDIRMEFDENLMGHISIEVDDPGDVIPDPLAKSYDPAKWNELFSTRWMSPDEIEVAYGKAKADRLMALSAEGSTRGFDSFKYDNKFNDEANREVGEWWSSADPASARSVRLIRVVERQYRKLDMCFYYVDPETGDSSKVPPSWSSEKRDLFAQRMGLFVHRRTESRIRWRVTADKVLLHDDWSPYRSYTKVPFFPFFRRGKPVGLVTNLISPQELLNKVSSQELHVVNSTANGGWRVRQGALTNMTTDQLAAHGSETGLVIEVAPDADFPERIEPSRIPTGLDRLGLKAGANIKEISGVSDAFSGIEDSAEVSGVALDRKIGRGQVQVQLPLENLARTRKLVARKILELVQSYYTEARVMQITRPLVRPGEPATEELVINQPTPEGEVLNDVTRGRYTVVVSTAPARDTHNDSQFAEAVELRNAGILIPDDRIVEYSNLDKKYELAEELRDMTGRGEMSPEEIQMQQHLQELELKGLELDLAMREAELGKVVAEIDKIKMETGEIPADLQLRFEELEAKVQLEREGYATRIRLAREQSLNNLDKLVVGHKSKLVEQANTTKE